MMQSYKLYRVHDFIRKNEEGELDFDRSLLMIRELAEAASYHNDHNILVDIRDTEAKLNFVELLTVALEFAQYEDVFQNRMAFLIPNEEERIRRAEYVKKSLVGVMRFKLEYFTEYEKAMDWLSVIRESEDRLSSKAL